MTFIANEDIDCDYFVDLAKAED